MAGDCPVTLSEQPVGETAAVTSSVPLQSGAMPASVSGAAMPSSYQMAAPLNEAELTALLMASPLYQKMEAIKHAISGGRLKLGGHKMQVRGEKLFLKFEILARTKRPGILGFTNFWELV